eukprot:6210579-Pleurochrysis_carterae.AAC.3
MQGQSSTQLKNPRQPWGQAVLKVRVHLRWFTAYTQVRAPRPSCVLAIASAIKLRYVEAM